MSSAASTTISTLDGTLEKRIMMEMEIQFSKGRTDRVLVHYDDDPAKIALEFVNRNRLKESAIPAISKHIKTTIDNFLSSKKILNENKYSPKVKETNILDNNKPNEEVKGNSIESSSVYTQETSFIDNINNKTKETDSKLINSNTSEDILSAHINTNSTLVINPKQYQENIDRNMNMNSFSYNQIATELVASSELSLSPAIEANKKATNMKTESNTYQSDIPFEKKLFTKRTSSLMVPITNSSNNKYNNNANDSLNPSPINTPVPMNKAMIYPVFDHLKIQKELNDVDDDDDNTNGNYNSFSNNKLQRDSKQIEDEDMESVSEMANTDADINSPNNDNDEDDDNNFNRKVDNYLEEFDPEAMYNRIRKSFYQPQPASISSASKSISTKNSSLKYKHNITTLLRPSSTTMQLTTTLQSKSIPQHSMIGKNTNERLYIAAKMKKDKRERTNKQKEDELDKKLFDEKFKVNKITAKIVEMIRPRQQQNSIHERLHEDGIMEKQLKVKRADELKDILQHQEWSCAKCGTFHSISRAEVVIQPLHQMKSRAMKNVMIDNKHNQPLEICKECGWNQTHVEPFKPINIGLTLSENIAGSNIELNDLTLDKRWTGREDNTNNASNIHEYLYANARTRENISQLNRVLYEESNPDLTFTPRIPDTSKEIIDKYRSTGGVDSNNADYSINSYLNSFEQNINSNHMIGSSSTTISNYLNIPTVERLANTKTLSNGIQMFNSMNSLSQYHQEQSNITTNTNVTEHLKTSKDREQFTNRLVYEYKSKHDRIQKLSEMYYKYDYQTGRPLFQPKIGPNPDEALGYRNRNNIEYNNNNQSIDIFTKIIHKDEELKQKRKYAEAEAIKKELNELEGMKIKPLHNSMNIIHQSNQRNAKELFDLLLHTQIGIFEKNNYKIDGREIEMNVKDYHDILFLDYVNTEIMLDHVRILLHNILYEKIKKDELMNKYPYNGVSFEDFKVLALICVNYKEGPGKGYICAPKKIPELAIQMNQQKQLEITFHPIIDKNSADICYNRYNKEINNGLRVEDTLHLEGEKLKLKHKEKQEEILLKEKKELTFQPSLYKAPSYIIPKYRGMDVLDDSISNSNNDINNNHNISNNNINEKEGNNEEIDEGINNNQDHSIHKNMNKKLFNTLTSSISHNTKQTNISKHNALMKTNNNKLSKLNKLNTINNVNNNQIITNITKANTNKTNSNKTNNNKIDVNNNSSIISISSSKSDDDLTINTISTKFSTINNDTTNNKTHNNNNNNNNNNKYIKDGNRNIPSNINKINNSSISSNHNINSISKGLPLLPHEIQKLQIKHDDNNNNNNNNNNNKDIDIIKISPKSNLRLSSVTAISNNSSNTIIKDK